MPLGPAEDVRTPSPLAASTRLVCEGRRSSTSDTGVPRTVRPRDTASDRNPCSFPIAQYSKAVTDAFLLSSRPARTPKSMAGIYETRGDVDLEPLL
jgi:hypothetical protein